MSITVRAYRLPLKRTYRWAKGAHDHRSGAILRAEIGGAVGWGEIAFGPHVEIDGPALETQVATILSGLDPAEEGFLDALDRRDIHNRIRAGIVSAWLSARAAAADLPLNRFLQNGRAPQAAVPINGLVGEQDIDEALKQCAGYVEEGMTTFKIKCFDDVEADLERVGAIRAAYPRAAIRLDPNDAWKTVDAALHNLERFAALTIEYVEDPLDTHLATIADMAELRSKSPVPVAWDNPVNSLQAMQELIDAGAVDVFVFKMPRAGGPDRQLAMIDLAARHSIPAVMTDPIETGVGMLASLHVASLCPTPIPDCGFSLSGYYANDIVPIPPIEDGVRVLPDTPGLGVDASAFWENDEASA